MLSVSQSHEGGLLAHEKLLNHQALACLTEEFAHQDILYGSLSLFPIRTNDNSFSCGEAIGLNHIRRFLRR